MLQRSTQLIRRHRKDYKQDIVIRKRRPSLPEAVDGRIEQENKEIKQLKGLFYLFKKGQELIVLVNKYLKNK